MGIRPQDEATAALRQKSGRAQKHLANEWVAMEEMLEKIEKERPKMNTFRRTVAFDH
jgi:hypothetical protein